jgi:hypothetical protein
MSSTKSILGRWHKGIDKKLNPSFLVQFRCRHVEETRALPSVLMHQALSLDGLEGFPRS